MTAALTSVLVFGQPANAQITVPASTLPVPGDTLRLSQDMSLAGCVSSAFQIGGVPIFGQGLAWSLTCLGADSTHEVVYRPASEGSVSVPGATMFAVVPRNPLRIPGSSATTEDYYNIGTDGRLQLLASYGRHFDHVSDSVFNYLTPLPERAATLAYASPFSVPWGYSGTLEVPASALPSNSLPADVTAVRYRMTLRNQGSGVRGWGTMTIPGGAGPFNVLSESRAGIVEFGQQTIEYQNSTGAWAVQAFSWPGFRGGDTLYHTSFYNDVSKEPIAVIDYGGSARPVRATFKRVLNDGDPCGDQSSSACNLPDTWSASAGACVPNLLAAGTACGSGATTACSNPDTCDGAGACVANDRPNGTACSNGDACITGETCQNAVCTGGVPAPACAAQIALLTAVPQVESCGPANNALDPNERVTYAVTLKNNSSLPTTNLVATLLPSANVSSPSGAQSYGAIPPGGTATRSFTWTGIGACGVGWSAGLALADGTQNIPGVSISGTYGTPAGCSTGCAVVRIATRAVLTRNAGGIVATVTVSNTGSVTATNVILTSALLGTSSGVPLAQTLNSIAAGGSTTVTLTFPTSVVAGANVLKFGGTYTGGTFSSSLRVAVP